MVWFVYTLDGVFVHFISLNDLNGIGGTLQDSEERPIQMTFSLLGQSWSSNQPINPAYHIEDCWILSHISDQLWFEQFSEH